MSIEHTALPLDKADLLEFVEAHFQADPHNTKTVLLLGRSGFGKTSTIKYHFENNGYIVKPYETATLLTLIRVVPNVLEGYSTLLLPDIEFKQLIEPKENADKVLIILDEVQGLFDLPDSKQIMLRRLIMERVLDGGSPIGDHVRFIILGNDGDDNGTGRDIVPELAGMLSNNLAVVKLDPPSVPEFFHDADTTWGTNIKWCKAFRSALLERFSGTFPNGLSFRNIRQCNEALNQVSPSNYRLAQNIVMCHFPDHISNIITPTFARLWQNKPDSDIPVLVDKLMETKVDSEIFTLFQGYLGDIDDLFTQLEGKTNRSFNSTLIDNISSSLGLTVHQKLKLRNIFLDRNTFQSMHSNDLTQQSTYIQAKDYVQEE